MANAERRDGMNIELNIERLVLDGVPLGPDQGDLLRASVEAELQRLLTDGDVPPRLSNGGAVPDVSGATIHLAEKADSRHLGQQIAGAIYGGMNP